MDMEEDMEKIAILYKDADICRKSHAQYSDNVTTDY